MQNQVVVDVSLKKADLDLLVACGKLVETRLKESGLFKSVGMEDAQALMPDLLDYVSANLPALFTADELRDQIQPLLKPDEIRERLENIHASLLGLESIGQAALISKDPLNFRGLILSRLSHLAPATGARIYRGNLLSADSRHLLVIASPIASSTATEFAGLIMERMNRIAAEVSQAYDQAGQGVTLTTAGAYRAALDNQQIIKKDIGFAGALSTIGIAVCSFSHIPDRRSVFFPCCRRWPEPCSPISSFRFFTSPYRFWFSVLGVRSYPSPSIRASPIFSSWTGPTTRSEKWRPLKCGT
jgi:hypothetical protein